jgi:hypothetical protein
MFGIVKPHREHRCRKVLHHAGVTIAAAWSLPLVSPLDKTVEWLKGHLAADANERDKLMLETIAAEVVKHSEELQRTKKVVNDQAWVAMELSDRDIVFLRERVKIEVTY